MPEKLVGYPIVFWSRSLDLGGFVEQIAPSAVERTFTEKIDVRALVAHDPLRPLGRLSAGTLRLSTDRRGLRAEIDPPETSYADDALESIRRGDATGFSFSFRTLADSWVMDGETPLRTLTDMIVREVSAAVVWPAYVATEAASRYANVAHVEECGTGVSDRESAQEFAGRFRRLAADCPGLEVRGDYTGERARFVPIVPGARYRPSVSLLRAKMQLDESMMSAPQPGLTVHQARQRLARVAT